MFVCPLKFRRRLAAFVAMLGMMVGSLSAVEFDLRTLPAYRAKTASVHGVVRIHDTELSQHLVHLWQDRFLQLHPLVRYSEYTVPAWFSGLGADTADFAVAGRRAYRSDLKALEGIWGYPPLEIIVATGGFNLRKGNTPGAIIFVHKDNPLSGLAIEQLDGIFGAERTGGWEGTKWSTANARGPGKNIRTWGQLGLKGEWADKPIHVYGPPGLHAGGIGFFQRRVMGGSDRWAQGLAEYDDRAAMIQALSHDPYGIAYTGLSYATPEVKPIALAENEASPYVALTRETVTNRSYPLARPVYIYFAPDTPGGGPADPPVDLKVREFLRYILSRQGQEGVVREGDFLPLMAATVHARLHRLDEVGAMCPRFGE